MSMYNNIRNMWTTLYSPREKFCAFPFAHNIQYIFYGRGKSHQSLRARARLRWTRVQYAIGRHSLGARDTCVKMNDVHTNLNESIRDGQKRYEHLHLTGTDQIKPLTYPSNNEIILDSFELLNSFVLTLNVYR